MIGVTVGMSQALGERFGDRPPRKCQTSKVSVYVRGGANGLKTVPKLCPNILNNPSQNRMEPHRRVR
jgi:hypothetical protein